MVHTQQLLCLMWPSRFSSSASGNVTSEPVKIKAVRPLTLTKRNSAFKIKHILISLVVICCC